MINFFKKFNQVIQNQIPPQIKLIIKLIYDNVLQFYNVETNNYSHLYVYLIFNFIINPKNQEIYNISSAKNQLVRTLNQVLRVYK